MFGTIARRLVQYWFGPRGLRNYELLRNVAYSRKSYSQFGEDLRIVDLAKGLGIVRGRYVDVGAFHPRWFSNTYALYQLGWSGVCIDLDKDKIRLFKILRPRDLSVATGIGDHDGPVEVYRFETFSSAIDTLSREQADRFAAELGLRYQVAQATVQTFDSVMKAHEIEDFNFLNIDIEGFDELVIASVDLTRYKPELICLEFYQSDIDQILVSPAHRHLAACGYRLRNWVGLSCIYLSAEACAHLDSGKHG